MDARPTPRATRKNPYVAARVALALLALALPPSAGAAAAEATRVSFHLAGGELVTGEMIEFDAVAGLAVRRDDNGGYLRLRWDQVHPADVQRILQSQGFAGDEPPPVQLEALRITTTTGEVVGLDAGREDGNLLIRRRDQVVRVPQASVRRIETVLVDALEVEDPTRLLAERQNRTDPTSAVELYNLALYAEGLAQYEQAKSIYEAVLAADPQFSKRDVIQQRSKALEVKMAEREETALLNRARALKSHGRFDDALAVLQQFVETYPSSRQLKTAQRELADAASRRKQALLRSLRTDFFHFLADEFQQFVLPRDSELGAALGHAKEHAFEATIDRVAKAYRISREEVLALWQERPQEGASSMYSYGGGTFVLGPDARKGYSKSKESGEGETQGGGATTAEKTLEERLAEKLKEKAKEREAAAKKRKAVRSEDQIADVPPTPEDWWKGAGTDERRAFLIAFFGEHTPHVTVVRRDTRPCIGCAGKGSIEAFNAYRVGEQGQDGPQPCTRCKTLGFDRLVSFK